MKHYLNVPSSYPLTRAEAVEEAKGRNIDAESQAGIVWQGDHGQEQYLDWDDMTGKEKQALGIDW